MKILHTADWHLGQSFYRYDRGREHEQMFSALRQIVIRHCPDALIVSGDVYDTMQPSAQAVRMYNDRLLDLHDACPGMHIVVVAGNHDSPSRIEVDTSLWRRVGVTIVGDVAWNGDTVDLDRHLINITREGELAGIVVAVPFLRGRDYGLGEESDQRMTLIGRLQARAAERNAGVPVVVAAHDAVRAFDSGGDEQIGNIDYRNLTAWPEGYDYLALGHIHRPHTLTGSHARARYAGTPLAMSFDEVGTHSVSLVTLNGHDRPEIEEIPIEQPIPMLTVPPEPAPLEDAFAALRALPSDEPAYVRLNVADDNYLPASARADAAAICEDTALRFCDVVRTGSTRAAGVSSGITLEDFRSLSPSEVARRYFEASGIALSDAQRQMLSTAIGEAEAGGE